MEPNPKRICQSSFLACGSFWDTPSSAAVFTLPLFPPTPQEQCSTRLFGDQRNLPPPQEISCMLFNSHHSYRLDAEMYLSQLGCFSRIWIRRRPKQPIPCIRVENDRNGLFGRFGSNHPKRPDKVKNDRNCPITCITWDKLHTYYVGII